MVSALQSSILTFIAGAVCINFAFAEKDVEGDPTHHKTEFENDCVRVVRASFEPGEKTDGMFDTKNVVVVGLTGAKAFRVMSPDGKITDLPASPPGVVFWAPGGNRIGLENTSDARVEYIVIEPKTGCVN